MTSEQIEKAINDYMGYEPTIDEGIGATARREAFRAGVYWLAGYLCDIPMKNVIFELTELFLDIEDEQRDNLPEREEATHD